MRVFEGRFGRLVLEQLAAGERVAAEVVNGGPVKTRKGINLPDTHLPFDISDKAKPCIQWVYTGDRTIRTSAGYGVRSDGVPMICPGTVISNFDIDLE